MPITVDITVDQFIDALAHLSPSDAETLIETLERQNLLARWEQVRREVAAGELVTEEDLFADLD